MHPNKEITTISNLILKYEKDNNRNNTNNYTSNLNSLPIGLHNTNKPIANVYYLKKNSIFILIYKI